MSFHKRHQQLCANGWHTVRTSINTDTVFVEYSHGSRTIVLLINRNTLLVMEEVKA